MLRALPLVFVLAGLVLYVVLAGADFGAGIWQLLSGPGERGRRIREHAHHSMGPVWEANHVWLIFILTVSWTAYPVFLASVASTLAAALFIAGLGIILRGALYALAPGLADGRRLVALQGAFAIASLITPFALGAAAGAIAAQRVHVGNATGPLLGSWTGPLSLLVGALSVCFSAYLAAVYLAGDAARRRQPELVAAFRRRALAAGAVSGTVALAGLLIVHSDAESLYRGLVHGGGLAALGISLAAGAATLALIASGRFELARVGAAVAVAAVIAGWAFARWPVLLPGLPIARAAASHDTLVALVVAVLAGAILLFPALGLLFSLTLGGRLGGAPHAPAGTGPPGLLAAQPPAPATPPRLRASALRTAAALLVIGVGMLNVADAGWAHAIGVIGLAGFVVVASAALLPVALAGE
ncbi:MAG TPA: cytochrome d ubiquinol oxidase subunit II [Solirubrobacteraceae bacterium]|nr:cytochrome d ubiquinol oxidase subunit II [Solirubrobacteraceae bacterium]